jgi:Gram-negative bacterial TonB protein C-terminal
VTRRIVIAACALLAVLWFGAAKADALTEFCPAVVANVESIGGADVPSTEFSYVLDAKTARTVDDAAIIAETDQGWFQWSVANVALQKTSETEARRGPTGVMLTYTHVLARSGRQMVVFPGAVFVRHAWITSARSSDETLIGWGKQGEFACGIPAFPNHGIGAGELTHVKSRTATAVPAPVESALPPLSDGVVRALPASIPFEGVECATPFREVRVTVPISPNYPSLLRGSVHADTSVIVDVAVDEDGHVLDTALRAGSGYGAFDTEGLRVARASTYSGAVSYCQKVQGEYIFTATFESK